MLNADQVAAANKTDLFYSFVIMDQKLFLCIQFAFINTNIFTV